MKRTLTLLLLLVVFLSKVNGQVIPDNYKLLVSMDIPKDLKWGIPSEILIDSVNDYFAISYDYNPVYLDFYKMDSWEKIKRVKLRGFTYFDNSYFDKTGNSVYIDKGRYKNRYKKIDLKSFEVTNISCDKVPRGCPYRQYIDTKSEYFGHTTIINNEWYIIKFDLTKIEVYLRKS